MLNEDFLQKVRCWRSDHQGLRFGQWVYAVCGGDPFYVEDDAMADNIEKWCREDEEDMTDDQNLSGVHVALLSWWLKHRRDFPWRHEGVSDYQALVTEILLWKTTARAVAEQWEHFFIDFPTIKSLAAAKEENVDHIVKTIGLRKRSEMLVYAAFSIDSRHGGVVPATKRELLELSGVGEYAASAYLCFHHHRDEVIVDTNVTRVLTRLTGCRPQEVAAIAQIMLPLGWAPEWNYALLDLGALICGVKPKCGECPLKTVCEHGANDEPSH